MIHLRADPGPDYGVGCLYGCLIAGILYCMLWAGIVWLGRWLVQRPAVAAELALLLLGTGLVFWGLWGVEKDAVSRENARGVEGHPLGSRDAMARSCSRWGYKHSARWSPKAATDRWRAGIKPGRAFSGLADRATSQKEVPSVRHDCARIGAPGWHGGSKVPLRGLRRVR